MTIQDAVWNYMLDSMDTFMNTGTAGAAYIQIKDAAGVDLAAPTLTDPAFGAAASGSMSIAAVTTDVTVSSGVMARAIFMNKAAATAWEASIGVGAAELNFSNTTIGTADQVGFSAITIAKP